MTSLFLLFSILWLISTGSFGLLSIKEKEPRAARIALAAAAAGGVCLLMAALLLPTAAQRILLIGLASLAALAAILFVLPGGKIRRTREVPTGRFDERQIVLARWRLKEGTPQHESYYSMHPGHKAGDDLTRAKPGLYSPESLFADPLLCTAADASFSLVEGLVNAVDGPVAAVRREMPIEEMTAYVKGLARYYGALDVGITDVQPYHVYCHAGRSPAPYGAAVEVTHKHAIALSVEMDYDMTGANPTSPGAMETAKQYVEVARAAIQLAAAIRLMGYPARAHIEANYQVICPLVAQDAGLGEIGRMGIVITPRQGPRVRLAAVTTDLPLLNDARPDGAPVIDFCTLCKKCAENCPSQSIPFDDRQEIDGALRWKINADTCIRYWMTAGTDCGRCMTVCPYSHPDNVYHNLVRWGIERSALFRRLALRMDDLLYGRVPARRKPPAWTEMA